MSDIFQQTLKETFEKFKNRRQMKFFIDEENINEKINF